MESGENTHDQSLVSVMLRTRKTRGIDLWLGANRRIIDESEPVNPSFVSSLSRRNKPTTIKIEMFL